MTDLKDKVKLPLRLILLGFVAVLVQESAVSQISIFGVSADITPLVVMSVGLLCGSLTGAVFGFALVENPALEKKMAPFCPVRTELHCATSY